MFQIIFLNVVQLDKFKFPMLVFDEKKFTIDRNLFCVLKTGPCSFGSLSANSIYFECIHLLSFLALHLDVPFLIYISPTRASLHVFSD